MKDKVEKNNKKVVFLKKMKLHTGIIHFKILFAAQITIYYSSNYTVR